MSKNETPKTTFRFPPAVKSKLNTLAKIDGYSYTDVVKHLINKAYAERHDEIKDYRENLRHCENVRENEKTEG